MSRATKPDEDVKPPSAEKDLTATDTADAQKAATDVVIFGNPDAWELICKASSQEQGWMKSTKRLQVERGYLYQTETQQRNPDGSWALSQALQYVKT